MFKALLVALSLAFIPLCSFAEEPAKADRDVGYWTEMLTRSRAKDRVRATKELGILGARSEGAVGRLRVSLLDDSRDVRTGAAEALGRIGVPALVAIPDLLRALQDRDEHVQYSAAWALGRIGVALEKEPSDELTPRLEELISRLESVKHALQHRPRVSRQLDQVLAAQKRLQSLIPVEPPTPPIEVVQSPPAPPAEEEPAEEEPAEEDPEPELALESELELEPLPPTLSETQQKIARLEATLTEAADNAECLLTLRRLVELGPEAVPALLRATQLKNPHVEVVLSGQVYQAFRGLGRDAVPPLLQALTSDDETSRASARDILLDLGEVAHLAVPALTSLASDGSQPIAVRISAMDVLGAIGERAESAVSMLAECTTTSDHSHELRLAAAAALAVIGATDEDSHAMLIELLAQRSEPAELRALVAESLAADRRAINEALPAVIGLLSGEHSTEATHAAIRAVSRCGLSAADAVPSLIQLVSDPELSDDAISALGQIGPAAADAIPVLVDELDRLGAEGLATHGVCTALGQIGPAAIHALRARLETAGDAVQCRVLEALAEIGPPAAPALPALLELLQPAGSLDADNEERMLLALQAVAKMGPAARSAVPDLAAILLDREQPGYTRGWAAIALGAIGPDAAESATLLQRTLASSEEDSLVRSMAAEALGQVSSTSVPELLRALADRDPRVRLAAAGALRRLNLTSRHALPSLIEALPDPEVGELAEFTLLEMRSDAIPALSSLVEDPTSPSAARIRAAEVLGQLGPAALPALLHCLSDAEVTDAAEQAIMEIGSPALPALLDELERQPHGAVSDTETPEGLAYQRMIVLVNSLASPEGGSGHSFDRREAGIERIALFDPHARRRGLAMAAPGEDPVEAPGDAVDPAPLPPEGSRPSATAAAAGEGAGPGTGDAAGSPLPARSANQANLLDSAPDESPERYHTVRVYYGTNRQPIASYWLSRAQLRAFGPAVAAAAVTVLVSLLGLFGSRTRLRSTLSTFCLALTIVLAIVATRRASTFKQMASVDGTRYGTEHSDQVEMGICEVTIPKTHKYGAMEAPALLKLEFRQDPEKHIVLQKVEPRTTQAFYNDLGGDMAKQGDSLLVFVHGYNVSFDSAARRTAQMVHDLKFRGVGVFFSWPSQANWYKYRMDEKQAELAVDPLKRFLVQLARQSNARSIHLVAHSLGSRPLTAALKEMEDESHSEGATFNQVVLAAPDIDADIFKYRIAPAILPRAERITLYASSNDLALVASRTFNGGDPRAGDSQEGLVIVPGIETIDVSNVDSSLLGHSYFGNSVSVIRDLQELLDQYKSADERHYLTPIGREGAKYWEFRPDLVQRPLRRYFDR